MNARRRLYLHEVGCASKISRSAVAVLCADMLLVLMLQQLPYNMTSLFSCTL